MATFATIMWYLLQAIVWMVFLKAIFFGSDFNFYYWFKHNQVYWNWYWHRETFEEYLKRDREPWEDLR